MNLTISQMINIAYTIQYISADNIAMILWWVNAIIGGLNGQCI